MKPGRHGRRAVAVAACSGAFALLPFIPPAGAAPPDVSVVVTLRPADARALTAASRLPAGATQAQRRTAIAAARPTASAARRVTAYLEHHGFTVTDNDGWVVSARGPRATAATLRSALPNDVDGVVGLAGNDAVWRHHAIPGNGHTGPTLKSAYDVVRPNSTGAGLTIATVQFSGWNDSDLTTYATAAGIPSPTPTEISVGTGNPNVIAGGGDFEVALDQEVILATAPSAAQRIYFGENSGAGSVALYSRIATDAEGGLIDVVSTSWGMCEPSADVDPNMRPGMETQLARIIAAGATVFAASGDFGAYDCSSDEDGQADNQLAVDFPAASASVVAVGGTRLTGSTGSWTESAWNEPTASGAFKGYGGGGGESNLVARPAWQSGISIAGTKRLVPDIAAMADPNQGAGPGVGSGFTMYVDSAGGWNSGGGTSAAAPIAAGHLAAALSSASRTTGVGDIHDELYDNPTAFRDVTTGNNLLYSAGTGYDRATGLGAPQWTGLAAALLNDPVVSTPPYTKVLAIPLTVTPVTGMTVTDWFVGEGATIACGSAGSGTASPPTGFTLTAGDRATHVSVAALDDSSACHVGTAPVLLDTHAPTATGTIRSLTGTDARTVVAWGATDAGPSSGVRSFNVCVSTIGSGCAWVASGTTARSMSLTLAQGRTYVLRVAGKDAAGNLGPTFVTPVYVVPLDGKSFQHSNGWSTHLSTKDWYGSHTDAAGRGLWAQRSVTGRKYELLYISHPNGGLVDVFVNGTRVKRINTYSSTVLFRRITAFATYSTVAARTVKVVVVGAHDSRSHGNGVLFDAVRVSY
ncbi:MAG: hypothetical protein QOE45_1314 [Frankiaceae bacterium]|jgi:hypothetical protein|nr:hypothetical protein [Frankiaceae bacterium]